MAASSFPTEGPPPPEDALLGKTLVQEGVLTSEQLRTVLVAQQTMRSEGATPRLEEVLVRQRLLTPEQVRQYLRPGAPTLSDPRDQEGKPFGRYRLLEELGRGGMGVVWKAWDTQLKRVVALKQILAGGEVSAGQIERFMREAQLAAKLAHPRIVPVHDVGVHERQHYFTTEYIAGRPLDEAMRQPVAVKQAVAWVRDVAKALAYAHGQGVVHRDVKPANILIDGKGEPHVMDFGLAKDVDVAGGGTGRALTMSGALMGTPQYMSPEQASGQVDRLGPATDQFSLGVVLYEMLTRKAPFDGSGLRDLLNSIIESDPVRPTSVNARLHRDIETICLKALEKDPGRRYASMADFAADLGRYLEGEPIQARRAGWAERAWRRVRRSPVVSGLAAALVVAALVAGGVWWKGRAERDTLTSQLVAELSRGGAATVDDVLLSRAVGDMKKSRSYANALDAPIAELKRRAPMLAEPWYYQGRMLRAQQKDEEAEKAQDRAVDLAGAADATPGSRALLPAALYERGVLRLTRYKKGLRERGQELLRTRSAGRKPGDPPPVPIDPLELEAAYPELPAVKEKAEADLRRVAELGPQAGAALRSAAGALVAAIERDPNAPRLLEEALAADRRMPEIYEMMATMSERAGKHEETAACCERARKADLGYLPHTLTLAQELDQAADASTSDSDARRLRAKALQALEDYLALDETCVECWCEKANLLRSDGLALSETGKAEDAEAKFQQSLRAVDRALAIAPGDATAKDVRAATFTALGDAKQARGEDGRAEHERAIQDYTDALKIDPQSFVYYGRGKTRMAEGDLDGAIQDCTEALKLDPRCGDALNGRGVARGKKGDLDGAIQDYTEALKINPRDGAALNNRACSRLEKGDLDGAIQDETEALKIDPRNVDARVSRGCALHARGDHDGAIRDCTEALKLNPRCENAFTTRGAARLAMGDLDGAIQDAAEALKTNPRSTHALRNRGLARAAKGDFDGAIRDFTDALKIDPRFADAICGRADARVAKGDADGAIEDWTEALKIGPRLPNVLFNRGNARLAKGDLDGAIQDATEALKIDPRKSEAFAIRGNARQGKGDLDGAIEDYAKALDVAPATWPYRQQVEEGLRAMREKRGK